MNTLTLPEVLLIGVGVAILAIGFVVRVWAKWERERDQLGSAQEPDRRREWNENDAA